MEIQFTSQRRILPDSACPHTSIAALGADLPLPSPLGVQTMFNNPLTLHYPVLPFSCFLPSSADAPLDHCQPSRLCRLPHVLPRASHLPHGYLPPQRCSTNRRLVPPIHNTNHLDSPFRYLHHPLPSDSSIQPLCFLASCVITHKSCSTPS